MSYEITARQNGKNVTLSFGQVSDANIRLKITSKSFFGTVSNLYHSARDGNLPVQKDTNSDWDFIDIQMQYYRGVLSALDINVLGTELHSAAQVFKGDKSTVSKEQQELPMADANKTNVNSYSCKVTVNGQTDYHAQFFLINGLLEVVVSSLKDVVKPKYDSREDAYRPMLALGGDKDLLNYSRHLHYQFALASLSIDMSTACAMHVLDKFVTKPDIEKTPTYLPPVDLWKEGPDKGTHDCCRVSGKKGNYLVRRYLVNGKSHLSVESLVGTKDYGYHSPHDKKSPPDSTTDMHRFIVRMQYFHKKLADFGIDMDYKTFLSHYATHHAVFDDKDESQSDVYHYEGGHSNVGHWNLDFVSDDDGVVQVIATSVVQWLPDSILYNSTLDPNCPPISGGSLATTNSDRIRYFKKKLAGLQLEMRPARWQQVFDKFIKGKEPMYNDPDAKVIATRSSICQENTILVELMQNKEIRVRLIKKEQSGDTGDTQYDSVRDIRMPILRGDLYVEHLGACFDYCPEKLAAIGAWVHLDWWYSVFHEFLGYLKEEPSYGTVFEEPSFRPRNVIPVLLSSMPSYPNGELVPDQVRDALKKLIEDLSFRIVGMTDITKFEAPAYVSMQGPSTHPATPPEVREISFFANEKDGYPLSSFAQSLNGVSFEFMLIEPDPTQKVAARAWMFSNAHITTFIGVPPIRDLSLSLEERSTEVQFVFKGEQTSNSTTMLLANKILSAMHAASANPHIRKL